MFLCLSFGCKSLSFKFLVSSSNFRRRLFVLSFGPGSDLCFAAVAVKGFLFPLGLL